MKKYEEKVKVTSAEIIVTGTKDKPYFELKYKEVGKEDYSIGYSSYDLKNVVEWKNECFEVVGTNGGWILCSERLPKLYKTVLIQYHSKINNFDTIVLAHIDSFVGWKIEFGGSCDSDCVIAWQPLPKPYNPKGE